MRFIQLNSILIAAYFLFWIVVDVIDVSMGHPQGSIVERIAVWVLCTSPLFVALVNWKCLGDTVDNPVQAVLFAFFFVPLVLLLNFILVD
jgi:hypothetical protein